MLPSKSNSSMRQRSHQHSGSSSSSSTRLQCIKQRLASCRHSRNSIALRKPTQQEQEWCNHRIRCVPVSAADRPSPEAPTAPDGIAALPAAAPVAPAPPMYKRWQLVSRKQLAGGLLEVVAWEGDRMLRVWLPPGYSLIDARSLKYPVLYLNDGQNLFGDSPTMSGSTWDSAKTAADLITSGRLPPFIIVGLDHAGPLRSLEYTPCTPGTGPGGFRSDAAKWPGGGVEAYLERVKQEVVPWVASNYPVSSDPRDMAFGGSSFGGIAALVAGMKGAEGCGFGSLLIESPSLWIGEPEPETFLKEVLAYEGSWPERVYIGMGGKEFSGTRNGKGREHDVHFPEYLKALYATLTKAGLGPNRLAWSFEAEHGHTESAWAARLPAALQFVCGGWWQRWIDRYRSDLFFTLPRRLKAGLSGQVLFFNKSNSHTLRDTHGNVKIIVGRNGWKDTKYLDMAPVSGAQQLRLQPPKQLQEEVWAEWRAEHKQQLQKQQQQEEEAAAAAAKLAASTNGKNVPASAAAVASSSAAQQQQQHVMDPQLEGVLGQPSASCGISDGDWYLVQLPPLPADCYELNLVFSDEAGNAYDNNDSNDFYLPVRQPEDLPELKPVQLSSPGRGAGTVAAAAMLMDAGVDVYAATLAAATAAASAPADEAASAASSSGRLFFSQPPCPTAGAVMTLYVNRAWLSNGLADAPNVKVNIAFNDWQTGQQKIDLKPTSLWRGENLDWWSAQVQVPSDAVIANFVFCAEWNGSECWDNNWGHDYQLPVRSVAAAAAAAAAEAAVQAMDGVPASSISLLDSPSGGSSSSSDGNLGSSPKIQKRVAPPGFFVREVESSDGVPHADGTLEILELKKRSSGGGSSGSRQRWWDEKRVRVWLPPGFSAENPPPGGWPALIMCDGQNMFEDWLAHQGVSWHLGHAASGLISVAAIPPCVCIAVDSAGPYRSYNYLPCPPGTGEGGFRGDAARWPGGGAHDFLMRLTHEILPMLQQRYNLSQCPSRLAFGGGSFAGVTALMAATTLPDVFGGILVESPSLWVGEGRFLQDLANYSGRLPERLSLGCGTLEYSATRDHDRPDVDYLLLQQYHEAVRLLQERGLRGPQRLKFLVEEGAGHHEGAWRWRLSGALQFLAQGWYDG